MEVVGNNFMPGDTRLVEQLVYELKSQGIFDRFRKECISDVDTKPAYQNLRQRVEGSVSTFLKQQVWSPDMNKNQVREQLRKNIYESGYLDTGVERIVDQVVNPKINTIFLPEVEDVVYRFLGIVKPVRDIKKDVKANIDDLLPTDLEAVSPDSAHSFKDEVKPEENNETLNDSQNSGSKPDEDESPPFEPLDVANKSSLEENSVDSHLSGFSGLQSHGSNNSSDIKVCQMEISSQDSQVSHNSSESRLSIITSEDVTKMEVCEDSNSNLTKYSVEKADPETLNETKMEVDEVTHDEVDNSLSEDVRMEEVPGLNENDASSKNEDVKIENEKKSGKSDDKRNDKKYDKTSEKKSRSSDKYSSKDKRDCKRKRSSSNNKDRSSSKHSSSKESSSKSKEKDRSRTEAKSSSSTRDKEKNDKSKDKTDRDRSDREKKDKGREKSNREKEKSDKEKPAKEKSEKANAEKSSRDKEKSSKEKTDKQDKEREKSEKDKSHREKEKTDREKSSKDKDKSSKSREKSDKPKEKDKYSKEKSSKENSEKEKDGEKPRGSDSKSSSKDKRDRPSSSSKHSDKDKSRSSNSSSSRDKPKLDNGESKSRSSATDKGRKDGKVSVNGKSSGSSSDSKKEKDKKRDSKKSSKDDHYSSKDKRNDRRSNDRDSNDGRCGKQNSFGSSSENNSSRSEKSSQELTSNSGSGDSGNSDSVEQTGSGKREDVLSAASCDVQRLIKPKFASNFQEARKIMKIRKQLAMLERQKRLGFTHIELLAENGLVKTKKPTKLPKLDGNNSNKRNDSQKVILDEKVSAGNEEIIVDDPGRKTPDSPLTSQSLKVTELSKENWEALEARLAQEMSNVKYSSYYSDEDMPYPDSPKMEESMEVVETVVNEVVVDEAILEDSQGSSEMEDFKGFSEDKSKSTSLEFFRKFISDTINQESLVIEKQNDSTEEISQNNQTKRLSIVIDTDEIKKNNQKAAEEDLDYSATENCYYLEKPTAFEEANLRFLHEFVEKLQQELYDYTKATKNSIQLTRRGRKRKANEIVDVKNNNDAHYKQIIVRKRGRPPGSQTILSKVDKEKLCNNTDILSNDRFPLPLSPAESDKSNDKKEDEIVIPSKRRRIIAAQRYSSDDLYKPRPVFCRRNKDARKS